jgi:Mrp family chromosome partitioning ATPase
VTFVSLGLAGARRPIALEVAQTLAGHGAGTVCLVDASFGAAALHERVGVPAGPGLCDALLASRPAASLAVSLGRQLWMVPAGEEMCAAPEWLPVALSRALRQLAARFDFVIVEAPPLERDSGMPTLLTVAPLTDGVVLVLEAERTRRDVAGEVVARLRASGVTVLGVVLTNRKSPVPDGLRRRL